MTFRSILTEQKNYQDLYRFVSSTVALSYLNQGFINAAQFDFHSDDPDYDPKIHDLHYDHKKNEVKPRIYTTRDKNYHYADEYTDENHVNKGALYGTPQSNIFCFVLDGPKITERYKVKAGKDKSNNFRVSPEEAKKGLRNVLSRSEAEERILTKSLPLKYIKEIEFMERVAKNRNLTMETPSVKKVFDKAKELGIKISRSNR